MRSGVSTGARRTFEGAALGGALAVATAFRYAADRLTTAAAARAFGARREDVADLPGAIDLAFDFRVGDIAIAPMQVRAELEALLARVSEARPRVVLELGTARGGTLFLFCCAAAPDATLVSVDLPGGRFGGGYPRTRARLYRSFARPGQRVELVVGDSHDAETASRVRHALGGREVDFLFVDGDHSAEGVRLDYETYTPLVRDGGLVAFHDIVPGYVELVGGVPEFWRELKSSRRVVELVHDWNQGAYGIGLVEHERRAA